MIKLKYLAGYCEVFSVFSVFEEPPGSFCDSGPSVMYLLWPNTLREIRNILLYLKSTETVRKPM